VTEKRLPFRLYAQILIFSALVALGALILWSLQQSLYGGMSGIRDNLISRLERQIGRKIRYTSISPSIFGSFDVRNVSIMGHDNIPLLTMSRFRIAYSLLDIIMGRSLAINSVQLDSPLIYYNTDTDNDLLDLFVSTGSEQKVSFMELFNMLPEKITIRIRNGKCQISSGNDNFELDALNFNAGVFAKSVVLDGKWNLNAAVSKLSGDPINFQIAMTANGLCQVDMGEGEALVSVSSITGDVKSADQVVFNAVMRNNIVNIRKKPDSFPFDVALEYRTNNKNLEGRLSCDKLKLARLISFSGGLEGARPLLESSISGSASIERGNDGYFGYTVKFAGSARGTSSPVDTASDSSLKTVSDIRPASFEIDIIGNQNLALIEKLHFSMPHTGGGFAGVSAQSAFFYGDAGFTGSVALKPFAPAGTISLVNFSLSGRENMNAEIDVDSGSSGITLSSDAISVGQGVVDIAAFKASFEPSENKTGFSVFAEKAAGPRRSAARKKEYFSVNGFIYSGSGGLEANILLDSFSIGDLAGLSSPIIRKPPMPDILTNFVGDTAITSEIYISADLNRLSYNTKNLVFSGKSGGFSGSISINGTESRIELDNGRIKRGDDILMVSARADFEKGNDIGFSINSVYHNREYYIKGSTQNGKTVNIQGSYGLNVNITASGNKTYSGVIHTEKFPIPFIGEPALFSLEAKLRYDSTQAWSMEFSRFELADIISPVGLAQFSASGRADQTGVNFPALYYKDGFGPLSGNINIKWTPNRSEMSGAVVIADNIENYRVDVAYTDNNLNLILSGSAMRLGRFSAKAANLTLDGETRLLVNSAGSFNADISVSSLKGKMYDRNFNMNTQIVINDDELTVRRIVIGLDGLNCEIPQFIVNKKAGTAGAKGDLKLLLDDIKTEGFLTLNANFTPVNSWFKIGDAMDYIDGKVHVEKFRHGNNAETQNFDIDFTRGGSGNALFVSGGPKNMLRLQVDNDGNFYAGLSSPSPVRGTAIGNISDNTINASCNDLYIDIAGLFDLLPKSRDIYLTGGYVNAAVDIRGSLSDPGFFGQARGTSLRFMIPSFIPVELRPIPFNIIIEGNEVRFGPVSASVGKGAGSASGQFFIDRWIPSVFNIDINIPRETPVPYSVNLTGLVASGDTSGKMKLTRENMSLDVSGDLYVNNTVLGINSQDISKSQGQDSFMDLDTNSIVNLAISTGPVVEFVYPDSKFPILRANPDIGTKLRIKADTAKKQFSIASEVKIRGGEIFYFERSFYIRSGLIVFKENELRFAPRLSARAEVRDRNEDGPVTISMIVDNAPLMDFTARFESTPPLSQMEILALMGQSITGGQTNENTGSYMGFVNSATDILAQLYMYRQFENRFRNLLQLDMFSFRTQFFQNALFAATGLAQQPVDRIGGLGNYFDNTTLFGGKYIGQDMFVQGMLSMRYDANKNTFGVQPDLGLELQGAMFRNYNFRIRWDFTPEHPENWYANDNSITLTVSKTY
jgi:hypothetical protein